MFAISEARTREPLVALTFDDGPNPGATPDLLGLLGEHGARATFFVVGESAARYPELVDRIHREGHALGNHSWSHPSMPGIPARKRREEVRRCAALLGVRSSGYFRPPYGHQSVGSWWDVNRCGHRVVGWSLHAEDWLPHPADWMAERILQRLRPGRIVLLHDALHTTPDPACRDRTPMLGALERVLEASSGEYRFVTLPDLLLQGRPVRKRWLRSPGSPVPLPEGRPAQETTPREESLEP